MPQTRTIVAHSKLDAPVIDAFQCSHCGWFCPLPTAQPFVIAYRDAEYACQQFDQHRREDYVPRERGDEALKRVA